MFNAKLMMGLVGTFCLVGCWHKEPALLDSYTTSHTLGGKYLSVPTNWIEKADRSSIKEANISYIAKSSNGLDSISVSCQGGIRLLNVEVESFTVKYPGKLDGKVYFGDGKGKFMFFTRVGFNQVFRPGGRPYNLESEFIDNMAGESELSIQFGPFAHTPEYPLIKFDISGSPAVVENIDLACPLAKSRALS